MTGNIVKLSVSAAHDEFFRLCLIVTAGYGLGSGVVRVMAQFLSYTMLDTDFIGMAVFLLEVILLIVTIFVGSFYEKSIASINDDVVGSLTANFDILLCGFIMAIPLGVQYSAAIGILNHYKNLHQYHNHYHHQLHFHNFQIQLA